MKKVIKYMSNDGTVFDTEKEAIEWDNIGESEYLVLWCSALKDECENECAPNCKTCGVAKEYKKYGTCERS